MWRVKTLLPQDVLMLSFLAGLLQIEKFTLGDDVAFGRQSDGGSLVKATLIGVVSVAPMQQKAVVPPPEERARL